ncbi:MAG: hypothetical protein ABR915_05730 [Thermoguttaceae bacterium]
MTRYRIKAVWWPDGWEPCDPLDVPRCLRPARRQGDPGPELTYEQAVATVRGLNRQNIDHPAATWYVISTADDPAGPADPAGIEAALAGAPEPPIRVVFPEGSGRGDCSRCPAHDLPCAAETSGATDQTRMKHG